MKTLKALFPCVAAIGVYFIALHSPMQKQMNEKHSVENVIKSIPVERFK